MFGMLIVQDVTAFAQFSIHPDSCICYTDDQDKRCLECLINSSKKDSLLQNQKLQILNFKKVVLNSEEQKIILNNLILDKDKEIVRSNRRAKLLGMVVKIGMPGAALGGLLVGLSIK